MTIATDPALAGLLADILAHPEQDAPRLIYADRLDEVAGEATARGELIRVQVELASKHVQPCVHRDRPWPKSPPAVCALSGCKVCRDIVPLRHREHHFLSGVQAAWPDPPLPGWYYGAGSIDDGPTTHRWYSPGLTLPVEVTFRRGFVESLTLSASDWLAHADMMLACQPVTEVTLTTWPRWRELSARTWKAGSLVNKLMTTVVENEWDRIAFTFPQVEGQTVTEWDALAHPD